MRFELGLLKDKDEGELTDTFKWEEHCYKAPILGTIDILTDVAWKRRQKRSENPVNFNVKPVGILKANSHMPCRAHAVPKSFPCHSVQR
jgi:hypothetical protein